jgi:hypothetical protein
MELLPPNNRQYNMGNGGVMEDNLNGIFNRIFGRRVLGLVLP